MEPTVSDEKIDSLIELALHYSFADPDTITTAEYQMTLRDLAQYMQSRRTRAQQAAQALDLEGLRRVYRYLDHALRDDLRDIMQDHLAALEAARVLYVAERGNGMAYDGLPDKPGLYKLLPLAAPPEKEAT